MHQKLASPLAGGEPTNQQPLRIGIELTGFRQRPTGSEVYMQKLVKHMGNVPCSHQFTLFVNVQDYRRFREGLPANFAVVPTALRWRPTRTAAHQLLVPIWAQRLRLDILHSTTFVISFLCRGVRQVLTAHDMTFFTLPNGVRPPSDTLFRRAVLASLRRADRILVPSESTAAAIRRLVAGLGPDRIKRIPLGVDNDFTLDVQERVPKMRRRLRLPEKYILFVGTLEPRKNLLRLVAAYTRLVAEGACPDHLVLAGRKGWNVEALIAQVSQPVLRKRVHILGYVSAEDLPALYAGAHLFAFPSIEEGFGLPPIEAMACGTPTVASGVSAMEEVLQGAAELVDPKDTDAIAAGLRKVLTDGQTRRRLREAGLRRAAQYRWDKVARKTLGVYEEVAAAAPSEMTDDSS